jgi:hypothetical protein
MDAALLKNALARDISPVKKIEVPIKGSCPFIFQIG